MQSDIHETIAQYEGATVVRELHDVPPYRVYEVDLEGRRAVVKLDDHPRGRAAAEGRVQAYVGRRTAAAVPEVLAIGDDHFVAEYHPAFDAPPASIDADWARAAGAWLATLHAETAGTFDGFGRPRGDGTVLEGGSELELEARDDWLAAVRDRLAYHRTFLEPLGYADVVDRVDDCLRAHPHALDGAGGPVLCHGDVHPEHLARTGDGDAVAIDFEHALVAPAAYDYWRVAIPYLEATDDVSEAAARAFRAGYESVRSLPDGLERRRPVYVAVTGVSFLESLHLQRNHDPAEREAIGERLRAIVRGALEEVRTRFG